MNEIIFKDIELSLQKSRFILEKIKTEYRRINPFEAFLYLGEGKTISRLEKDRDGNLVILNINLTKYNFGEPGKEYCGLNTNNVSFDKSDFLEDIFSKQWFITF